MSAPVRVLQVLGALEGGGVQSVVLRLLKHLDRSRFSSDVCVLAREAGPLAGEAEATGARILRCPPRPPLRFAVAFPRLVREGRYDIVHVHRSSSMQGLAIALAAHGGAVPIAHYHNTRRLEATTIRRLGTPLVRGLVQRHARAVLGVSRPVLTSHFGLSWQGDGRFRVFPNGIETERFAHGNRAEARARLGLPPDALVLGHTGRFAPAKNHATLIAAAAIVVRHRPDARFLLVGDGELRPAIEAAISAAGLQANFLLAGWRDDTASLYAAMDVFLFPSLWEGFGLVLAEAQAAGVPCVTSDLECFAEVLAPELWAIRFPAQDAFEMASAILALVADPERCRRMGANAAAFVRERFEMTAVARRLEGLYSSLMDSREGSGG